MNLENYAMPKIIYEILYNRLIYTGPEQVFKATKDVDIPLNKKEALNYYYKHCAISKSTRMISHTPFASAAYSFTKIYIDIIEHKLLSTNGYKYAVRSFERYSNRQ